MIFTHEVYSVYQFKKNGMGGACDICEVGERCILGFGGGT